MLLQLEVTRSPYIGVFCNVNENLCILPPIVKDKQIKLIEKSLQTKVLSSLVGESNLVGVLSAMNSYGMVVTSFTCREELKRLCKEIPVIKISDKLSAVGNNILANDMGAVVHPGYREDDIKIIKEVLHVEVGKGTIAGAPTIGSFALATNKGVLAHPEIKSEEIKNIECILKVPVKRGTANFGKPLVGACVLANTKGAITSTATTGIELGRIEEVLL